MTNFKMSILAKHIMTPNPVSCYRYNCLDKAINIMGKEEDKKVSYIVIIDEKCNLLGILSIWNIARFMLKFNLREENLADIPVNNLMQIKVPSKDVNTPFEDVLESMIDTNSECIICTEIGNERISTSVKGIICKRDILEEIYSIITHDDNIKKYSDKIIAENIMNTKIKEIGICYKYENIIDVKKRMAKNNIKHIRVIDEINDKQKLIKVISYKDIIGIKTSKPIGEIKTRREDKVLNGKLNDNRVLITCFKNTKLSELVETMITCHVGVIPVIDNDNTLLGIVGRKEIFEAFLLVLDNYKKAYDDVKFNLTWLQKTQALQTNVNVGANIDRNSIIWIPRFAIDIISPMQQHQGVICCAPSEKVRDVGLKMKNKNITHIVMTSDGTDDGALLNVISTRDITVYRRIMATVGSNIDDTPICDFANPICLSILYCSKYTSFSEIVEKMVENRVGDMIVVDRGKVNIEEEISSIKKNLQEVENEISEEIEKDTKTEKRKVFYEILGEEYTRIIIESNNPNPDVTKITSNIANILKTYLSLIGIEQNEEIIEKFKNITEKELLSFILKIPEEKFNSQKDLEKHLEKLIDDLKNYVEGIGINEQKEQVKRVKKIMDGQKNAVICAFKGDITKAINNFSDELIRKTKKIDLNPYFIYVLKRKINDVSNNILKIQLESQNVKDEIESINAELVKILSNTNIQRSRLENCKTIIAKTLWIIAESHKKDINSEIISNNFADVLKICVESAYTKENKTKIIETWNKKVKDISENFRYGLSKIVRGKIVGFISRSDVLRGIKTTLSFLRSSFIERGSSENETAKIYAKAEDIIKNKEIKDVVTCSMIDKVINIDRKMCRSHIGHCCIVDNKDEENELLGIISFEDLVPTVNFPANVLISQPVWKVASKKAELFVCDENALLEGLIDLMIMNKIGAIPVVEKKKISCAYHKNIFDELMTSLLQGKRSILFIPAVRELNNITINNNINFLNPLQNFQAQSYLNTLLSEISKGRISKIILLVKRNEKTSGIFAIGIDKKYNRKLIEELKNKKFVDVRMRFKKFNEMLKYINADKRIGGIIIENEDKDLFNYRYILKGIIAKRELFKAGLNVIKIIDNLTL